MILEIDLDNQAFHDGHGHFNPASELECIFSSIVRGLRAAPPRHGFAVPLFDTNGNNVGSARFTNCKPKG
jgi:hypothetical protein